ncbi:MAG: spore coat associated protein CotJA [Oscillospiraceae bacterium]|nr:spore coat associated protein CotJA [Oscillospiraceae bacterium]
MAYVPQQKWQKIYSSEIGFTRGTIFEELDKPFLGRNDC